MSRPIEEIERELLSLKTELMYSAGCSYHERMCVLGRIIQLRQELDQAKREAAE